MFKMAIIVLILLNWNNMIASKFHRPLCFQHPSDSLLFWVWYQILLPELGQSLRQPITEPWSDRIPSIGISGSVLSVQIASQENCIFPIHQSLSNFPCVCTVFPLPPILVCVKCPFLVFTGQSNWVMQSRPQISVLSSPVVLDIVEPHSIRGTGCRLEHRCFFFLSCQKWFPQMREEYRPWVGVSMLCLYWTSEES
jgi:hypothetical protein